MKRYAAVALAMGILSACAGSAAASATIDVTLWDQGATMPMMTDMGYGMHANMPGAHMGIKLSTDHVSAGEVTFAVTNSSKDTIHEMLVLPVQDGVAPPYLQDQGRVDEEAAGALGEVSELDPGKTGSVTLTLAPGKYLVLCNVPFHFMGGMWAVVTVQP